MLDRPGCAAVGARHVPAGAVLAFVWPVNAQAHSPIAGIGTFYGSLLHPLVVPDHALVLVGLSLALGQQGRSAARLGLTVLVASFGAGLAGSTMLKLAPPSEPALLSLAAVMSASVIVARPLPLWMIACAALTAGGMLGLDSAPGPAGRQEMVLAIAGLCAGVGAVATLIAGTCLTFQTAWQKIGIRVVGSWIFAASVLVLTLLIHSGDQADGLLSAPPGQVTSR